MRYILLFYYIVYYILWSVWYIFFFQAEDGIRDLVRSRGLGDVYKRQLQKQLIQLQKELAILQKDKKILREEVSEEDIAAAVSYTHLTLPTSDLV